MPQTSGLMYHLIFFKLQLEVSLNQANELARFYKESCLFLLEELSQNQDLLVKSIGCLIPNHALALHYSSSKVKKEYEVSFKFLV